jgi:predicted nucleic acid-binding protein
VAIAWYLPEAFSKEAGEWQRRMLKKTATFLVPQHLHFLEFGNVLRTYVRRGELETELAHEIYELHLEAPLREVAPVREQILETALEFDSTTYDAAYIALSIASEAPLVTAERSTTPWVVQLGDSAVTLKK